jgi:hypothetical protein
VPSESVLSNLGHFSDNSPQAMCAIIGVIVPTLHFKKTTASGDRLNNDPNPTEGGFTLTSAD